MVIIEKSKIEQIPVLHVVEKDKKDQQLPFVIFLHGFTSAKENNLHYSYLLAKKGFRVVLPEANYHGERAQSLTAQQLDLKFWEIVLQTIYELPKIKDHFEQKLLIDNGRIGVVGTSMGGIITLGALNKYDWIKVAVSLMGAPSYQEFARHQLKDLKQNGKNINITKEEVEMILNKLAPYDLSLHPEKLKERHLLFWHGKKDEVVPYKFAFQFYERIKSSNLNDNIHFIIDDEAEHKVSQEGIKSTVNWFEKNL